MLHSPEICMEMHITGSSAVTQSRSGLRQDVGCAFLVWLCPVAEEAAGN